MAIASGFPEWIHSVRLSTSLGRTTATLPVGRCHEQASQTNRGRPSNYGTWNDHESHAGVRADKGRRWP